MPQSPSMRQMLAEHMLAPKDGRWGSSGSGRKEGTSPVMASTQQVFTAPISLLASGTWGLGRAQSLWCQISGAIGGPEDHDSFQLFILVLGILAFPPGFPDIISHMPESQETIQAQKGPEHYTERWAE